MAWSGGTFTGLYDWESDQSSGIKILASRHKAQDDIFIAGINQAINKDGSNAFTGSADFDGNLLTNIGTITPATAGAANIGSASAELGNVYIADDKYVFFGSDQNITLGYDETTGDALTVGSNIEGAALKVHLFADQHDDASDAWQLQVADGGVLTLGNDIASKNSYVTQLTLTPHATVASSTVTVAGNLTVAGTLTASGTLAFTGDTTFTGDILSNASGSTTIGSASAEMAGLFIQDDGNISFGNDQDYTVDYDTGRSAMVMESALEGVAFNLIWSADQGDDAKDRWKWSIADGGTMTLGNDASSADTFITHLTLTPNATVASSTVAFAGGITVAGTLGVTGDSTFTGNILSDSHQSTDLGSTSATLGYVYIADNRHINFGNDQDYFMEYDTGLEAFYIGVNTNRSFDMIWSSDAGTDAKDQWKWVIAETGGAMTLANDASSADTFITHVTFTPHATVASSSVAFAGGITVAGTMAVTGDTTFTGDILSNASGSTTIGSASAEIAGLFIQDDGNISFGNDQDYTLYYDESGADSLTIKAAVEGAAFKMDMWADQGDDNADKWRLQIADGGVMTQESLISGSFVAHSTLTPNSTVASSTMAFAGNVTVGSTLTVDDVSINGDTITFEDGETITRAATDQMFFKTNGSTSGGKWQFNMGASNYSVFSMAQTGDGVGGTVFNEDGLDRDFRIETDNQANMLNIDGGTDIMALGGNVSTSNFLKIQKPKAKTMSVDANDFAVEINMDAYATTTAGSGTNASAATLYVGEPNLTIGTASITTAATVWIAAAPSEATNNYALFVDSGNCQFDGNIAVGGTITSTGTITGTLATAAQGSVTSLGTLTALQVDSLNLNGNTLSVTTDNPLLINPPGGRPVLIDGAVAIDAGVVTGVSSLTVSGAVSKGSGSFSIAHPLPALNDTHRLVHSFVEGPQADLIYRGTVTLSGGTAKINIDTAAGMTEGTFVLLCRDVQCFTTNEADWTPIKGAVSGNVLTITSQDETSTATVSWIVIGERQDDHMKLDETDWCDADGRVIVEPLKSEED